MLSVLKNHKKTSLHFDANVKMHYPTQMVGRIDYFLLEKVYWHMPPKGISDIKISSHILSEALTTGFVICVIW